LHQLIRLSAALAALAVLAACRLSSPEGLVRASAKGDLAAVKADLAAHVDVNGKDASGDTPLIEAAFFCHPDAVKALIAAGADANERSGPHKVKMLDGMTPLYAAASAPESGCPGAVKALIAAKADLNAPIPNGATALGSAALQGEPDVARLLLDAGADPNALSSGVTPLALATAGVAPAGTSADGRSLVAQLLLARGGHT